MTDRQPDAAPNRLHELADLIVLCNDAHANFPENCAAGIALDDFVILHGDELVAALRSEPSAPSRDAVAAAPSSPAADSVVENHVRERDAFQKWWDSRADHKFVESSHMAAGAAWFARAAAPSAPAAAPGNDDLVKRLRLRERGMRGYPYHHDKDDLLCAAADALERTGTPTGDDARDAARYRWLRDLSVPPHNFYIAVPDEFKGVRYSRQEVDAAIDAAMQRAKGSGG